MEGGNDRSVLWDWEVRKGWERSAQAAGSWDRFEEDILLLKKLNANAYRFSLEWSRVQPEPGLFDLDVLDRYAGWARRLKEEGIRPIVCLHHFSEPAWLLKEHTRGWLEDAVPARFLRFAEKAVAALKGEVSDWLIFNEPMVFLVGAYGAGMFPPGYYMLRDVFREFLPLAVTNLAAAHNETYRLIKRLQPRSLVGAAHNIADVLPARPGDEEAALRWDWFMHGNFLDLTKDCMDFLGINYYTRIFVSDTRFPFMPMKCLPGYAEIEKGLTPLLFRLLGGRRGGLPRTGMGWEVAPEGFERVVTRLWKAYKKPIYITENGVAANENISREDFLKTHLAALAQAMAQGADVRGYLHWSLVDNYEWGSYKPRFGLFTRQRRPSGGADLFARIAQTGILP